MNRKVLLAVLCLVVGFSIQSFAYQGKAYIPSYFASYNTNVDLTASCRFNLYLSNITSSNVTVEITFYASDNFGGGPNIYIPDTDDSVTTGDLKASSNVVNYDENPITGTTVKFEIEAYESITVTLKENTAGNAEYGYAVIEWYQDSENLNALLGHAALYVDQSYIYLEAVSKNEAINSIPINNGMPF